ncbi:chromosomal replication initiator DnaA [Halocynthiibacter sp.]|uniref:chromosomal replication initiator DnaA n=1 Tax=Halocynthiibacter sp. TaxID=1979210 RepID=UPI003C5860E7
MQLSFDLPLPPALGREDFLVSQSNAIAFAALENPAAWPAGKLALIGEAGSGKTHLAHVWAQDNEAVITDARRLNTADIEALANAPLVVEHIEDIAGNPYLERAMFHLHNLTLANRQPLLITGRAEPAHWAIALPDLKSRMQGTPAIRIDAPDDALLMQVMVKLFFDRGIEVKAPVVDYLVKRMDRSLNAARTLVQALDQEALARGKPIGLRLAGEVLDNITPQSA